LDEANRRGVNSPAPRDEGSLADALHGGGDALAVFNLSAQLFEPRWLLNNS
jgi:hypothetical protein